LAKKEYPPDVEGWRRIDSDTAPVNERWEYWGVGRIKGSNLTKDKEKEETPIVVVWREKESNNTWLIYSPAIQIPLPKSLKKRVTFGGNVVDSGTRSLKKAKAFALMFL